MDNFNHLNEFHQRVGWQKLIRDRRPGRMIPMVQSCFDTRYKYLKNPGEVFIKLRMPSSFHVSDLFLSFDL